MKKFSAAVKWHGEHEYLDIDPDVPPRVGDLITTWEEAAPEGTKTRYLAQVENVSTIKERTVLRLRYAANQQSKVTRKANAAWGTSTLDWSLATKSGTATWVDDVDSSRNGSRPLTFSRSLSAVGGGSGTGKGHCEVWTGSKWEIWSVTRAYLHQKSTTMRCYECKGRIVLMKQSADGRNAAHFEHKPAHTSCSLVYQHRKGMSAQPPIIVEAPSDASQHPDYIAEDAIDEIIGNVGKTVKERLVLARVGQGQFRKALVDRWKTCSVTECGPQSILVASHIVAWSECSTNAERLDVDNGLLLTPNLDKLFDRPLVSFGDDGHLLLGDGITERQAKLLGVDSGMRLRSVPQGILKYLARHRDAGNWTYISRK